MANVMKKGDIIAALDATDRAASKLSEVCANASDEDILHAALYAATDGTGDLTNRDLQAKRFKSLRTSLIKYREVTVKWNSKAKEFYIDKVGKSRGANANKADKDGDPVVPTKTVENGQRSKPAQSLAKMEEKIASTTEGRNKIDIVASIARQMKRAGVTIDDLAEYFADQEATEQDKAA